MQHEIISYEADGLNMKSQLFFEPASQPLAGVLVFPEAPGLEDHALSRARRLATEGYVALACDLHGDGQVFYDMPQIMGLIGELAQAPDKIRARAQGALTALTARKEVDAARIAAIGFCFGGTMSLELARAGAAIKAVTGFHSGLATKSPPSVPGAIKPRILVCIGADDPFIPDEQRTAFEAEMRTAQADWQMHLYGNTVHSFTNPNADKIGRPEALRYNPESDKLAWAAMHELFAETLA